jgi:hypothetical protein
MPRTLLFAVYLITTLSSSSVFARQESAGEQPVTRWTHALVDDIAMTWNEPQYHDLYVPFLSWHARFMYDKEKTDKYNEMPWGGGLGLSRYNDEGNWSALFAMMFKDSHNEWQPAMGYGWDNWQATVGLFTGAMAKEVVVGTLNTLYTAENIQEEEFNPAEFHLGDELFSAVDDTWQSLKETFSLSVLSSIGSNFLHHGQL